MIANYHTHTWRCNHAGGKEEEYVLAALKRGLDTLGFSDHAPYMFPPGYYSHFRMRPEQMMDYCDTVLALRQRYAGQLQMPLGMEMEYYPAYMKEQVSMLRDSPVEYLILGQHFIGNEYEHKGTPAPHDDWRYLKQYCTQCADAMQTGLFSYLAHPDLFYFTGDKQVYREHMRLICREAKSCGIPLEINLLGIRSRRNYPDPVFWELAAEEGCTCILGCDAHESRHLEETDSEKKALELVNQLGLQLLDRVELKKV